MARVWRRRRSLDTPRPAGRRWARLRSGGSRATQLIARVAGRRRHQVMVIDGDGIALLATTAVGDHTTLPASPLSPAHGHSGMSGPAGLHVPTRTRRAPRPRVDVEEAPAGPIALLPGERTPARRLKFAIANGCTIGSLLLGLVAVFLAMAGGTTNLRLAAASLLACVVLDGCDGGLARKFKVASPFGAQLDSLADLSSFGVATGIVVYQWLAAQGAHPVTAGAVCALIAVCAAIRLARFNVSPSNSNNFWGVPTTMVAAVLALNMLLGPDGVSVYAQVAFVAAYAIAMVTPFPYVKLGRVLRLPLWVWVVPAICAMISVPGTFVAVVGGYLVSGPVLWLLRRRGNRPALAG